MSGHSKWATIHRAKEAKDSQRGAIFTKLGQAISIAVRQGGGIGDPAKNFRLRLAIDRARQFNMPKDNITRAIDRATGGEDAASLEELVFEGFAPAGVAVLASAVTDNKLRTAQKVREVLDKSGGSMGGSGSVSYLFEPVGEIMVKYIDQSIKDINDQELQIIDQNIKDIERADEGFVVYCDKDQTYPLKEKLETLGYQVESAEMVMKPTTSVEVPDPEARQRVEAVLEKLAELDDIQKVWSNFV